MGGEVPRSYYQDQSKKDSSDHMKSDVVAAGNRKRLHIFIKKINSILR